MSWSETLLDASYRGVPLDVIDENLQAQRAIAQHGTPYQDGDSVEDLGRGARAFAMRVVLFGTNYEIALQLLLAALDMIGPGELVHPIYGSLNVIAYNWSVQHTANRPDYAEVSLQFIEQKPDEPFFQRQFVFVDEASLMLDDEPSWQDGLFDLLASVDTLVADVQSWIGGGWTGLLEKALGLPGIGLRLEQLRSQIMGVVSGVDSMVNGDSTSNYDPLVDLNRTPTEIRSAIQDSTPTSSSELLARDGVPAAVPGSSSLTVEAGNAGASLLASARQGQTPSDEALPEAMPSDPLAASGMALVVLVITELALSHAQAASVVIEAEAESPTLSPDQLEGLVNLVRSLIQSAILLQRCLNGVEDALPVIESLRNIAHLVQARARSVILQSPPLIERTVQTPSSLRLLAFRWYADHSRAAELLRLNPGLTRPYSIPAGEVLRAYAK
jgi:prophage DNA circulation protein